MDKKAYWVGFNLVKGVGSVRLQALLDYFGSLEIAWHAPADALSQAGLTPVVIENIMQTRQSRDLDAVLEEIEKKGIQVVTREDADYPLRLTEVAHPPPLIYIRGKIMPEDELAVAIVGTRKMTSYGRQVTENLAGSLATNGVTVVSGLARGIDAVAHETALKSGGRTLAVLGCGVDRIYPPEHQRIAEQIIHNGALISDYFPGTPPDSVNFPPRNRIISAMSLATVVVEASEKSGALITASFAADQGREVFAVPGNIFSTQSRGTNNLIQQGARPYTKIDDILELINVQQSREQQQTRVYLPADRYEESILQILGHDPLHVDEIRAQSKLPIEKVSAALSMMELKGMVRQVGSMNYVLRESQAIYSGDNL